MIGRMWRGSTSRENADAYEQILRTNVLPELGAIAGSRGAFVMRRDVEDGVEFVTLTLFDSLEAVREFAGPDYETAVIIPEAEALLSDFDAKARHYEIAIQPASIT
jgi:heme-degrading monooxygenase HmoA